MIYGLNFNGTQIPSGWKRRFAAQIKVGDMPRGHYYRLQGVATDRQSLATMLVQADNGRRKLHTVERMSAAGPCFGVYTY